MGDKKQLVVKKYGNRRLYDTEASRYITLDELAGLLRGGRDVRVVDAKTNADLTKSVLLQIIAEQEKDDDVLPVAFLKQVIGLTDTARKDALQRYLSMGFEAFLEAQKQMEQRYKDLAGNFFNPLGMFFGGGKAGWTGPASGKGASAAPPPSEPKPQPAPEPPAPEPTPAEVVAELAPEVTLEPAESAADAQKGELEQLKAQMAEMQRLLAKLGGAE